MNRNISPSQFGPVQEWLSSDEGHDWIDSNFQARGGFETNSRGGGAMFSLRVDESDNEHKSYIHSPSTVEFGGHEKNEDLFTKPTGRYSTPGFKNLVTKDEPR